MQMDLGKETRYQILNAEPEWDCAVCDLDPVQKNARWTGWREHLPVYQKTVLENGIRVVTETMPGMRSIAIGIIVDAGPRDEPPDRMGLAHLTEHLMFQGTSNRNAAQIARLMDEGGGSMGAFTARDYTCFFSTVLDDYCTYALDLLGDMLLNSIFLTENLEREKSTILREMEMSRDVPFERAHDLLKSFAWPDHALGNPIIGLPDTLLSITRDDIIYFVHEHYLPNRMIISAAGNVDHHDFVAQTRDAFWRMLGEGTPQTAALPERQSGVKIEHMPVSQTYFSIGFHVPHYAHSDRYALHVFNNVLGGGSSSRLYRRIREGHGLVYNISSEYHGYRDDGLLVIEGSTLPEYLPNVLELVLDETKKLLDGSEPVDEDELWKAKMQIRGQHLITSESTNTKMSRLATQEFYIGRYISSEEIVAQIEAIDTDSFTRLTRGTLLNAFHQLKVALVGPEEPHHYDVSSMKKLLASYI